MVHDAGDGGKRWRKTTAMTPFLLLLLLVTGARATPSPTPYPTRTLSPTSVTFDPTTTTVVATFEDLQAAVHHGTASTIVLDADLAFEGPIDVLRDVHIGTRVRWRRTRVRDGAGTGAVRGRYDGGGTAGTGPIRWRRYPGAAVRAGRRRYPGFGLWYGRYGDGGGGSRDGAGRGHRDRYVVQRGSNKPVC